MDQSHFFPVYQVPMYPGGCSEFITVVQNLLPGLVVFRDSQLSLSRSLGLKCDSRSEGQDKQNKTP